MIPFQKGEEREASVLSPERKILTLHGVNNQKRTNRCLAWSLDTTFLPAEVRENAAIAFPGV